MQHETELIFSRSSLVLPDHPAVGRRSALLDILTAHESEAHSSAVIVGRRCDRAAHATAEAMLVGESVPVDARRFKAGRQHAAGPICLGRYVRAGVGHDTAKG